MSTYYRRRRPAGWPGVLLPRLGLEALEPRCACAAGLTDPTTAVAFLRPPEGLVAVVAQGPAAAPAVPQVNGLMLTPTAGVPFTGPVGQIVFESITSVDKATAEFIANIRWGNGQQTAGVILPRGQGGYDVVGTMTYTDAGNYLLTIEVAGPDGTLTATGLAHVEPPKPLEIDNVPPAPVTEPQEQNSNDQPAAAPESPGPTVTVRTPGDTTGAIPWLRLPDPRPDGVKTVSPQEKRDRGPAATGPAVPPTTTIRAQPGGSDDAPVEADVGPAYLAAAGDPPAEFAGAPPVDALPVGLSPMLVADDAGLAMIVAGRAAVVATCDQADAGPPAPVCAATAPAALLNRADNAGRGNFDWLCWESVTTCVALILTERMLVPRPADVPPRLRGRWKKAPPPTTDSHS
jgi:hypothetical protein